MSDIAEGSLPSSFRLDDTDAQIARLARTSDDDEPPRLRLDGTADQRYSKVKPSTRMRLARIEEGGYPGEHVIEFVRFGRDRYTTCSACDFTATGSTDREMAETWNAHPLSLKREHNERRNRHGLTSNFDEMAETG